MKAPEPSLPSQRSVAWSRDVSAAVAAATTTTKRAVALMALLIAAASNVVIQHRRRPPSSSLVAPPLLLRWGGLGNDRTEEERRQMIPHPFPNLTSSLLAEAAAAGPIEARSDRDPLANDDGAAGDFAVLIISYHKTGHDLQMDLVDAVATSFPDVGISLTEHGDKSSIRRRRHPLKIPCARFKLPPGSISVQHAPDLFCRAGDLARILLDGGKNSTARAADRGGGTKVVHLVRNPFGMAVSNYHYHARDPTPEPWVHHQNPCYVQCPHCAEKNYADLVLPPLSKMRYESLGLSFGGQQLLTGEEFDRIVGDCQSLYQTRKELNRASFYDHLMNYDAPEGLRLATAELTIQGYENGGDLFRMTNNIVKLKQAQMLALRSEEFLRRGKELRIFSMTPDDFVARPAKTALRFFDFILDGTGADVPRERREGAALEYERRFREKAERSGHITHGKWGDSVQLEDYLRRDPVFGPPLGKVEKLVETVLAESHGF